MIWISRFDADDDEISYIITSKKGGMKINIMILILDAHKNFGHF